MRSTSRLLLFCTLLCAVIPAFSQQQQFANLGDFKLESGEVLRDCRIGYRTFGQLNAGESNVILFPTWASGTTEQLMGSVGPGKLADSSKYYVILVDALSNGVSSSPSNSALQPHMRFPTISIGDMVNTEHELLTKVLNIQHAKAVMGISMGGMQTFQWMVSYADFIDKAIPIVGAPRLSSYSLVHTQAQIDAIENDPGWHDGDYDRNPARGAEYEFGALLLKTPAEFNRTHSREQVIAEIAQAKGSNGGQDANNKIRQSQAMIALDVSKHYGGSMERAAAAVKAKVLVIVAREDHAVTPEPAIEFSHLLHADLVVIDDGCGHQYCDYAQVGKAVAEFLEK
jgi:homoserine O-acetyltransferase